MTLIELLVVIVILTTLVAAAIPLLSPARDDRRIREASRGVNTYISGAQAKAIALRRPFGVALKKLSQDTGNADDRGVCLELFYVEQPPAYRGFDDTSRARVALNAPFPQEREFQIAGTYWINFVRAGATQNDIYTGPRLNGVQPRLPAGIDYDPMPPSLIRPGDRVVIGGSEYLLIGADISDGDQVDGFYSSDGEQSTFLARLVNDSGQRQRPVVDYHGYEFSVRRNPTTDEKRAVRDDGVDAVPWFWTQPAPYTILRQPMPSSAEPYQLPEGIAIDLRGSGVTPNPRHDYPRGFFHHPEHPSPLNTGDAIDNDNPIYIIFTPEGSIERVMLDQRNQSVGEPIDLFSEPVVSNVYLLIGRRENSPLPAIDLDKTIDSANLTNLSAASDIELLDLTATNNWLNIDSRWVVVGSQSGRVVSTENSYVDLRLWTNGGNPTYVDGNTNLLQRRALQIEGARERANQMTQMGGR